VYKIHISRCYQNYREDDSVFSYVKLFKKRPLAHMDVPRD